MFARVTCMEQCYYHSSRTANNARAIGGLEGMAKAIDPSFNVLKVVYPYALGRLLRNPSNSPVVARTLAALVADDDGAPDRAKARALLADASALSGVSKRRIVVDTLRAKAGRAFVRSLLRRDGARPAGS